MSLRLIIFIIFFHIFYACEMDDFLFNEKEVSKYALPGNNIADSLLEPVQFDSENNTLYGYWIKTTNLQRGLTILYCHGNKHNLDEYWERVMILHELDVNVFIFDYRGFGRSEGESSEQGLYKDGEAALNFILSNYPVNRDSLCLYGYSLGNVVSIYLAAEKIDPLCLIAEAPFASANSLTQGSLSLDLPELWLTEGEFNNVDKIRKINTPFLLLHGEEDDFVRFKDNGKVVYANAPEPKSLKMINGAGHNNIPEKMGVETYKKTLMDWINFSKN